MSAPRPSPEPLAAGSSAATAAVAVNAGANNETIPAGTARRALAAFFVIGFAVRLWAAVVLPRVAYPDEIFQSQEPAHYLVYGYGVFSWEWREGVRSWVLPALLAEVMRATAWMGAGSSGYLLGIKIALSLLSLTTIGFAFAFARRESGNEAAIIAAGCCAMWFSLVDYGPRAFSEVISTHLLLPGLYLGLYAERIDPSVRMWAAGLLCGMAACLRVQYAPAIGFALLWFCFSGSEKASGSRRLPVMASAAPDVRYTVLTDRERWKNRLLPLVLGVLVPVVGFGYVDEITWGHPFASFLGYFRANLVEGRATHFGILPWYWYLSSGLLQALGPLLFLALFGIRRSPFLSWMALILVATHSVIPHKEVRFLYAIWPMAIVLAAIGTVEIAARLNRWLAKPLSPAVVVWSSVSFSPIVLAGALIAFPYLGHPQGGIVLFEYLSRDPRVCAVAETKMYWNDGGGYTYLDRDVPILFVGSEAEMNRTAASFNAVVTGGMLSQPPPGFALQRCVAKYCLYQRPGGCAPPPPELELNEYLKRIGR